MSTVATLIACRQRDAHGFDNSSAVEDLPPQPQFAANGRPRRLTAGRRLTHPLAEQQASHLRAPASHAVKRSPSAPPPFKQIEWLVAQHIVNHEQGFLWLLYKASS